MPEVSQSHADMHVVSGEPTPEAGLEQLEERIRLAVETIARLKEEGASLRGELEQARERIQALESAESQTSVQSRELQTLASERDRLLQDRRRTTARVETMLGRLKNLGFE